jgi:hypothetical protein
MRFWKITRWNGMQLEVVNVEGYNIGVALNALPSGMYDQQIISVEEVPNEAIE